MEAITKDQLNKNLKEIEVLYRVERFKVLAKYARSNDNIIAGDLITDHSVTIKVFSRKVFYDGDKSCMMYHGLRHKKDGTPFKKSSYEWVYQNNIHAVNGRLVK